MRPAGVADLEISRQTPIQVVQGFIPGALILGFFLTPGNVGQVRILVQNLVVLRLRERIELLDADDGDMRQFALAADTPDNAASESVDVTLDRCPQGDARQVSAPSLPSPSPD